MHFCTNLIHWIISFETEKQDRQKSCNLNWFFLRHVIHRHTKKNTATWYWVRSFLNEEKHLDIKPLQDKRSIFWLSCCLDANILEMLHYCADLLVTLVPSTVQAHLACSYQGLGCNRVRWCWERSSFPSPSLKARQRKKQSFKLACCCDPWIYAPTDICMYVRESFPGVFSLHFCMYLKYKKREFSFAHGKCRCWGKTARFSCPCLISLFCFLTVTWWLWSCFWR